jgi:predicted DNA-binding protein (MmcQ/YjbR family)
MTQKEIFDQLLAFALSKTASVIVANDVVHFRDPDNVAFKIGIQRSDVKAAPAFCYLFWNTKSGAALYFKHDPEKIQAIYQQRPHVLPSEIATQYWSKVFLDQETDLAFLLGLIDTAYALVLPKLPKGEQQKIAAISIPNPSWAFHLLALELMEQDKNWHLDYNICPELRYKIKLIGGLVHHTLIVRGVDILDQADWRDSLINALN